MLRAEITRIRFPDNQVPEVAQGECSSHPSSVLPNAGKHGSLCWCNTSFRSSKRSLKNICSDSAVETPFFSFLQAFQSSHSKPAIFAKSIMDVCHEGTRSIANRGVIARVHCLQVDDGKPYSFILHIQLRSRRQAFLGLTETTHARSRPPL